jgi:phospholipid/cholesterol/gamma-HCH transport system substrate-binding protein
MSQSRIEIKVGAFVLLGLVLAGGLALLFSRGTAFYADTYDLKLQSGNIGGIKVGASILFRGIQIGNVTSATINPDGKGVTMTLKIKSKHKLYRDARFEIEQSNFLGDQFIAIYPGADQGEPLQNGDAVQARNPFNMQEAVATATETLARIGHVSSNLDAAVTDVRRLVLTEQKLHGLGASLDRFAATTAEALATVSNLNSLVASNTLPVTAAVSNLNAFASELPPLADYAHDLVASNGVAVSTAIRNLEIASATLTNLMAGLQEGHGVAGRLLRDEELAQNLSTIADNLSITSSNLNTRGLWGIMWKQKPPPPPKTNPPAK